MASKRMFALSTRNFRHHSAQRTFHSYEHITPSQTSPAAANAILLSAYGHVPRHGFSHQSLNLGARDAGYLDISSSVLPDGVFGLILFHLAHQRLGLASKCEAMFKNNRKSTCNAVVGTKIADIMWARLLANKDIIHKWQEALAIMAQPSYAPASVRELALLSDEMCYLAGDESVDFSWYTKRVSLSMIYSTSELFMTKDKSPGYVDTLNFMLRRLEETRALGGLVDSISTWARFSTTSSVNLLRSRGLTL
ncbi:hypothetical protein E4U17_006794 [Claviceps sp. LM77 group G4]|nr:hypothetical protein E4U17_006794 [Claviceps sp. LM77 group G4]